IYSLGPVAGAGAAPEGLGLVNGTGRAAHIADPAHRVRSITTMSCRPRAIHPFFANIMRAIELQLYPGRGGWAARRWARHRLGQSHYRSAGSTAKGRGRFTRRSGPVP